MMKIRLHGLILNRFCRGAFSERACDVVYVQLLESFLHRRVENEFLSLKFFEQMVYSPEPYSQRFNVFLRTEADQGPRIPPGTWCECSSRLHELL